MLKVKPKEDVEIQDIPVQKEADIERLQKATEVLATKFGLGAEYTVKSFNDKGKTLSIQMENSDFIVAVTIKKASDWGLSLEPVE